MNNPPLPKGQKVTSPKGQGEVEEIIGDKVVIKLDNGHYETSPWTKWKITAAPDDEQTNRQDACL